MSTEIALGFLPRTWMQFLFQVYKDGTWHDTHNNVPLGEGELKRRHREEVKTTDAVGVPKSTEFGSVHFTGLYVVIFLC